MKGLIKLPLFVGWMCVSVVILPLVLLDMAGNKSDEYGSDTADWYYGVLKKIQDFI